MPETATSDEVRPASEADPAVDKIKNYTRNRNSQAAIEEARHEAIEHAGEFVARSLDGRQTLEYAKTFAQLRSQILKRGLTMASVVVEVVEDDVSLPINRDTGSE